MIQTLIKYIYLSKKNPSNTLFFASEILVETDDWVSTVLAWHEPLMIVKYPNRCPQSNFAPSF